MQSVAFARTFFKNFSEALYFYRQKPPETFRFQRFFCYILVDSRSMTLCGTITQLLSILRFESIASAAASDPKKRGKISTEVSVGCMILSYAELLNPIIASFFAVDSCGFA
jgi:hypothetical protein